MDALRRSTTSTTKHDERDERDERDEHDEHDEHDGARRVRRARRARRARRTDGALTVHGAGPCIETPSTASYERAVVRTGVIGEPTHGEPFLIASMDAAQPVRREQWRALMFHVLGLGFIVLCALSLERAFTLAVPASREHLIRACMVPAGGRRRAAMHRGLHDAPRAAEEGMASPC
jgi:hypothetical protein